MTVTPETTAALRALAKRLDAALTVVRNAAPRDARAARKALGDILYSQTDGQTEQIIRGLRLASKSDEGGIILRAINEIYRNHVVRRQANDRYILALAFALALATTGHPKPLQKGFRT